MSVRPAVTAALAQRQNWRCIWCEFEMAADNEAASRLVRRECPHDARAMFERGLMPMTLNRARAMVRVSFEHLVPHAHGGADRAENGLAACRWCNIYRGTEDLLIFKMRIVGLVAAGRHPRQIFRVTGRWPSTWPMRHGLTADALAEALAS